MGLPSHSLGTLCTSLKRWEPGSKSEVVSEVIFVAGGTFVELSVKLSWFLIWHMVTILRGRCSTADASGSFFVAVAVLQRLRRKMAAAYFHIFTVHFSWRPQYLVKI